MKYITDHNRKLKTGRIMFAVGCFISVIYVFYINQIRQNFSFISFLPALIILLICGFAVWFLTKTIKRNNLFLKNGKETIGIVVSQKERSKINGNIPTAIRYDSWEKTISLQEELPAGTKFQIFYLKQNQNEIILGKKLN